MGALTRAEFDAQMKRMVGLKFAPARLDTHWEALNDMPEPLLAAAVAHAQRQSDEFPSPKMLRIYGDQLRARVIPIPQQEDRSQPLDVAREARLPTGQVITLPRVWTYYCDECQDSGWITLACNGEPWKPWVFRSDCDRNADHNAHEWVRPCPCAATNPDVQRRRERERRGGKRGEES